MRKKASISISYDHRLNFRTLNFVAEASDTNPTRISLNDTPFSNLCFFKLRNLPATYEKLFESLKDYLAKRNFDDGVCSRGIIIMARREVHLYFRFSSITHVYFTATRAFLST